MHMPTGGGSQMPIPAPFAESLITVKFLGTGRWSGVVVFPKGL